MSSRYGASIIDEKGMERFNCNTTPFTFYKKITLTDYSWEKELNNVYYWDLGIPWGTPILVFKTVTGRAYGGLPHGFLRKNGDSTALHAQTHNYGERTLLDNQRLYGYEIYNIKEYYAIRKNPPIIEFYIFVASAKYLPKQKYGIEFYDEEGNAIYSSGNKTLQCRTIPINPGYIFFTGMTLTEGVPPYTKFPDKIGVPCVIVGDSAGEYTEDYFQDTFVWSVGLSQINDKDMYIYTQRIMWDVGHQPAGYRYGGYIWTNILHYIDCSMYD